MMQVVPYSPRCSCRDFAAIVGCSRNYVNKAIRAGRLRASVERSGARTGAYVITDVELALTEWVTEWSLLKRCPCGIEFATSTRSNRRLCSACRRKGGPVRILIEKVRSVAIDRRTRARELKQKRALQLRAEGLSQEAVAAEIGVSLATIRVWCRNTGHASKLTAQVRHRAGEMLLCGLSPREIAEKLKLCENTIRSGINIGALPRRGETLNLCAACGGGYSASVKRDYGACSEECRRVLVIAQKRCARRKLKMGEVSPVLKFLITQQVLLQRDLSTAGSL